MAPHRSPAPHVEREPLRVPEILEELVQRGVWDELHRSCCTMTVKFNKLYNYFFVLSVNLNLFLPLHALFRAQYHGSQPLLPAWVLSNIPCRKKKEINRSGMCDFSAWFRLLVRVFVGKDCSGSHVYTITKKTASIGFTDNQTEIGNLYCNDQVSSLSDEWDTNKNSKFWSYWVFIE